MSGAEGAPGTGPMEGEGCSDCSRLLGGRRLLCHPLQQRAALMALYGHSARPQTHAMRTSCPLREIGFHGTVSESRALKYFAQGDRALMGSGLSWEEAERHIPMTFWIWAPHSPWSLGPLSLGGRSFSDGGLAPFGRGLLSQTWGKKSLRKCSV